jgi:TolC family type I secretion outer membrane protein
MAKSSLGLRRLGHGLIYGLALAALGTTTSVAHAGGQTLAQALASAYSNNPTIRAERARQRATDEQVPQALSGWRPTVSARGDVSKEWEDIEPDDPTVGANSPKSIESAGFSIQLDQPIFRGFRTLNETKRAESNVDAGRQTLLAVEQQILFDAASAFMNVIRDREIVRLRTRNVSFLQKQLEASKARFDVGEITKTDVSQANARLSLSRSNLSTAKSNLQTSRATYTRLIGQAPGKLRQAKVLRRLPKTLQEAVAIAEQTNPNILAAMHIEDASRHNIQAVKGQLLPTLSLQARYSLRDNHQAFPDSSETVTVLGALSIPLYQAGRVYSEVREAKQLASQRRLEILEARRAVRENVVSAWHALMAARQTIRSFADQVSANEFALEGVRQEALVGSRTTLDVLDAEQELVDSQVSLANARRDNIVAAYLVLASIGKMTPRDLRLPVAQYDPAVHYDGTRNRLFGTNTETVE